MVYRITFLSNPRLLVLLLLLAALPAFGAVALVIFGLLLGLIILGGALFLDYYLLRFTIQHLKSRIDTGENGIQCLTPAKEELFLPWERITHSGTFCEKRKRVQLFVYCSEEDRLLKIPDEYSRFRSLVEEVREKTPFRELDGEVSVEEYLKNELKE